LLESANESAVDLSVRLIYKSKNDFMLKKDLTKVFTIYIYIYIYMYISYHDGPLMNNELPTSGGKNTDNRD
jgi:hypothetical protein